jgi:hypothetical protein
MDQPRHHQAYEANMAADMYDDVVADMADDNDVGADRNVDVVADRNADVAIDKDDSMAADKDSDVAADKDGDVLLMSTSKPILHPAHYNMTHFSNQSIIILFQSKSKYKLAHLITKD